MAILRGPGTAHPAGQKALYAMTKPAPRQETALDAITKPISVVVPMIVAAMMTIKERYQDGPATPILSVRFLERVTDGVHYCSNTRPHTAVHCLNDVFDLVFCTCAELAVKSREAK